MRLSQRCKRPDVRSRAGFTILELLVALVLMAFILTGLLALTRSALGYTSLASSVATSVQSIAQAEGYLSDKFRLAKRVDGSETLFEADGTTTLVECNVSGAGSVPAGRCLTILTPVLGGGVDQPIVDFDFTVFNVQPIGDLYETEGLPRGFDGDDTLALVEYKVENICAATGTAPCSRPPDTLSAAQKSFDGNVGVITTGLSPVDGDGDAVETFDIDDEATGGTILLLKLIARVDSAEGSPFAIRETPVELGVAVRGLIE